MLSEPNIAVNRQALLSLIFSIFTLLSFCIGLLPIPFTALICYPSAALLGLAALFTGVWALYQIHRDGGQGRGLAWIGILSGGLTLLAILCFTTLAISLFPLLLDFFRQNFQSIKFPRT